MEIRGTWFHVGPFFRRMVYTNILEFDAPVAEKESDGFSKSHYVEIHQLVTSHRRKSAECNFESMECRFNESHNYFNLN